MFWIYQSACGALILLANEYTYSSQMENNFNKGPSNFQECARLYFSFPS